MVPDRVQDVLVLNTPCVAGLCGGRVGMPETGVWQILGRDHLTVFLGVLALHTAFIFAEIP